MKILCPTDFTPRARAATRIALGLARRTGGSVELCHVIPPHPTSVVALGTDAAVLAAQMRADAARDLEAEQRALPREAGPISTMVVEGDAEIAIVEHATAIGADLIVMGAHGGPALERLVLGSVAERTVRRARCPVLIVPPGVESLGDPEGARPLDVLLALDGRTASAGAIALVHQLRAQIPCDVTCLRLYWPIEEYERLGLVGSRDMTAHDPDVVADLDRTLRLAVGVLPGAGKTTFAIEPTWGEPAARILDYAHSKAADLVVVGAESRNGLARIAHPPVAARIARRAAGVAILFVPPPAPSAAAPEPRGLFTVLAATDLSPAGNRAVPYAYELLAGHGGVVELCYVHERALASPAYAYTQPAGELTTAERSRLIAALRALVPATAERRGITTHVTVIDGGEAGAAIVQAGERLVADAIVLGSHGKSGVRRALLGSVSQEVVRRSQRPVLIVPVPKEAS
jgi:nucleotide-binding universal stress UspA family protein